MDCATSPEGKMDGLNDRPSTAVAWAERWASALGGWGIPDEILASAPESPWVWPASRFQRAPDQIDTPSRRRALEVLPECGSVLDVGAGAGWASLPLAPKVGHVTAVDRDTEMMAAFGRAATDRNVAHATAHGRWPAAGAVVEQADVVVCHHILYDVHEIVPFLVALTEHTRHRVVLELSPEHPTSWLNPLWHHFHGLERPTEPTAEDVVRILRLLGLRPSMTTWARSPWSRGLDRKEVVSFVRRRLCLPAERDSEIHRLLRPEPGDRDLITIWWSPPSSNWTTDGTTAS